MEPSILDKINDWKSKITVARELGVIEIRCPKVHDMDGYCFRCGNKGVLIDVKSKSLTEEQKRQARRIVDLLLELDDGFEDRGELSLQNIADFLASRQIGQIK